MTIINNLKSYFLDEDKVLKQNKQEIISNCEKIIQDLKNKLNLKYNNIDLIDIIKYRLLGYDINISNIIKVLSLEKNEFKKKIFLYLFLMRTIYYYVILNFKEKRDNYEINLIDCNIKNKICKPKKIDMGFICTDPSYFKTFFNIFDELNKQKKEFIVILPLKSKSWGFLNKLHKYKFCNILFIENLLNSELKKELLEDIDKFENFYKKNIRKIKKIFYYDNKNILKYSSPSIKKVFTRYLPQNIAYIKIANKIYSRYKIKVLIGGKIRRFIENSFFYAAKNKNIKTISIIPVLLTSDFNSYYDLGNFLIPDNIVVWDKKQKELINSINKNKKICVYGNPQWDNISHLKSKKEVKKHLNMHTNEKYIVICTQPIWSIKNIIDIVDIAKSFKIKIILKIHPKEEKKKYGSIKNIKIIDDSNIDFYSLLKHAEIMFTGWSTTCLEALMISTPAIIYNKQKNKSPINKKIIRNYEKLGIPSVYNKKKLEHEFKKIINNKKRSYKLSPNSNNLAGPTKKIIKLIKKSMK